MWNLLTHFVQCTGLPIDAGNRAMPDQGVTDMEAELVFGRFDDGQWLESRPPLLWRSTCESMP